MTEKGKRQQRHNEEDAAFNRMLIWLAGAVVAELIVFLLRKMYVDMVFGVDLAWGMSRFFAVYRFAGVALTAAAVIWLVFSVRDKRSWLAPVICAGVAAGLWVVSVVLYQLFDRGVGVLMMLPPAAGVLIMIWFLYQRTFFVSAGITGCGLGALWLCRQYHEDHFAQVVAFFVVGWVLLALAALLAKRLSDSDGNLGSLRLMPVGSLYPVIYLTCLITAAVMLLALLLGATAAFYLLFVLAAWLFVQAVFFTVKLM